MESLFDMNLGNKDIYSLIIRFSMELARKNFNFNYLNSFSVYNSLALLQTRLLTLIGSHSVNRDFYKLDNNQSISTSRNMNLSFVHNVTSYIPSPKIIRNQSQIKHYRTI